MRTCVIIGAAGGFSAHFVKNGDFIICADGGYDTCVNAGIKPNLIIGDFDSAEHAADRAGIETVILPVIKDVTDLQAAIDEGLKRGYNYFILTGCAGGRFDHYYNAVCMLEYLYNKGADGGFADGDNLVFFHAGGTRVFPRRGWYKYISVAAADEKICGVSLKGLKYPLKDACIERADSLGISNEFAGDEAEIAITEGRAFIIYSRDRA